MLCPEATHLQVQAIFTRALEREGLLDEILSLIDELAPGADASELEPILLSVSDNGAQMTSGSTREFMALHAIATHYGRPGTPTDQAHIESLFGHVKHEWAHLSALADPADLARELDAVRQHYNGVRLHAGIGYVTPPTSTRAAGPRSARRAESGSHAPANSGSPTTAHHRASAADPARAPPEAPAAQRCAPVPSGKALPPAPGERAADPPLCATAPGKRAPPRSQQ